MAPPEGGVPGKVLDAQMIKGSQPPMLRYIVRLDDGRNLTVDEPASRYLGTGDLVRGIVLTGTGDALPKRGFVLRGRHPIRLRVLDEERAEIIAAR